jgi:formylmethanofuran dehydrogenase subunit E
MNFIDHAANSNYKPCSVCGKYTDDGGLKDNEFVCHNCLEKSN